MRLIAAAIFALSLAGPAAAEFTITFGWGNIPKCTTGNPGRVGSPEFIVKGLPKGTTVVEFRLKDLDVPSYNHGGAKLKMSSDGKVPFGTFKYKSPCPPSGRHTYQWTATARAGNKTLATATAQRPYP